MIRLFNPSFRRQILMQVACDLSVTSVILLAVYGFLARQGDHQDLPATQGLSLLAGPSVHQYGFGPVHAVPLDSCSTKRAVRATLALILALLLSYAVFGILPPDVANREELRWLTMLSVAGVVVHRVRAGFGARATKPLSRI
jgi:hypothetical protein